jgi:hypothetical protein
MLFIRHESGISLIEKLKSENIELGGGYQILTSQILFLPKQH